MIDTENLPLVLQKIVADDKVSFSKVECFTEDRSLELDKLVAEQVNCDVNAHITSALLLMAQGLSQDVPINLLQGQYSRRERRQHRFQAWYPAAAMVAIWIVAQLLVSIVDNFRLSHQLDNIRAQQQQLFKQAFPSARAGGDVYRKMESELKRLKQKRGAADASFYHMLTTLAPTLGANADLQLQAMRYHEGNIDLDLRLPTLQSLDQLKASLASQPQWQVEIQSASSAKDHVEARLQIRSRT
jgi:general secretion pathway protein L